MMTQPIRPVIWIGLWGLLWLPVMVPASEPDAEQHFRSAILPLLNTYCSDCHQGPEPEAGINLASVKHSAEVRAQRAAWTKVLAKLRSEEMPPEDAPKPTAEERKLLTEWVDRSLHALDCVREPDPGRVTLRRLNRIEYRNTIRDLIGVDYAPADDFPGDDVGYGFDNIGDVLSLPPILLEKYLAAANVITQRAIVTDGLEPRALPPTVAGKLEPGGGAPYEGNARILASSGEISAEVEIAQGGEFRIQVAAFAHQAGDEPAKMELRIDGKPRHLWKVDATSDKPGAWEFTTRMSTGKHRVALAFVNDYYNPQHPDPKRRDRNLIVQQLEIAGPQGTQRTDLPESHQRLFFVAPGDKLTPEQAARQILERVASRAFRRPATEHEVARLLKMFDMARRNGENFEESIRLPLQAILVSPHFLFKVELDPEPPQTVRTLNDYELAVRLSYFLWSTMPDSELLLHAWRGTLRQGNNLETQVRRMLADARSQALVQNFAGQWLELRKLAQFQPDAQRFPAFNDQLRTAMRTETEMLFEHVVRQDRSLLELLSADYTFVNAALARHYGLPQVEGDEFRRVSLEGTPRRGLLTQASVLSATSNPTRTSPVKRGKWILENLLGEPPPPPPPNVPELMEGEQAELKGTLRQRMEQHRTDPGCASCHRRMDELGFALENFDPVGGWRDRDGESPIDAAGVLPSGEKFNGAKELTDLLVRTRSDAFARCLCEKLLTYGLGRGLEYYDKCAVDTIMKSLAAEDYRFSSLVLGIVRSDPFQKRTARRSDP